jgi:hypothetical protein
MHEVRSVDVLGTRGTIPLWGMRRGVTASNADLRPRRHRDASGESTEFQMDAIFRRMNRPGDTEEREEKRHAKRLWTRKREWERNGASAHRAVPTSSTRLSGLSSAGRARWHPWGDRPHQLVPACTKSPDGAANPGAIRAANAPERLRRLSTEEVDPIGAWPNPRTFIGPPRVTRQRGSRREHELPSALETGPKNRGIVNDERRRASKDLGMLDAA